MENTIKILAALSGAAAFLFGGWTATLTALLVFVVADYLTGITAAVYEGKLSSRVGLWGIARKVFIFFMVAIAHFIDQLLGDGSLVMSAVVLFYIANELISLLENINKLGLPVPDVLRRAIDAINSKSGGGPRE